MTDLMTQHYLENCKKEKPYSFSEREPLEKQKSEMEACYKKLLKMPEKTVKSEPQIEYERNDNEEFDEIRFKFESEEGLFIPAHILIPKGIKKGQKVPTVICLQGHSSGMHISLARPIYPNDQKTIDGDRDFARQAVRYGYIGVAMEQRGLGELKTGVPDGKNCHQIAFQSLMVGHTLLGERIFDISRLIDCLNYFENIDMDRIAIMGNSGGGTASYHAACVEPRISAVLASCSFNRYDSSIMVMNHCACNYIPGIVKYMEMPDLAVMIAPRPLLIVSGREDTIFPIDAAKEGFETVKKIYEKAGAPDNCKMVVGEGGHRFYAADAWPIFTKMI